MRDKKNVLFVTYYWPPAGGASVNRIIKFAKNLPDLDWNPIILTVEKGDYHTLDTSLENEIAGRFKVVKSGSVSFFPVIKKLTGDKKITSPKSFTDQTDTSLKTRIARWLKSNIIPDTRIFWAPMAIRAGSDIIKTQQIDLIFSSSPPQTNHIVAAKLSKRHNIPWLADLRDPWTEMYWNHEQSVRLRWINAIDKRLESSTLDQATQITTVGPGYKDVFLDKTSTDIQVIYNGFDEKVDRPEETKKRDDETLHLVYAGSMSYQQRPTGLFRALQRLISTPKVPIKVTFVGHFGGFLQKMIQNYGLQDVVRVRGYKPKAELSRYLRSADVLMVLGIEDCPYGVIPSKIFEYLPLGIPILGYGLSEDAERIITQTDRGKCFPFHDETSDSATFLHDIYAGEYTVSTDTDRIAAYSSKDETKQLAALMDGCLQSQYIRWSNE